MLFVRAYPRETQGIVFDAHNRAFAFFKGASTRGIHDNLWMPPHCKMILLVSAAPGCVNLFGLSLKRLRSWP
jgi:hypothetical protein